MGSSGRQPTVTSYTSLTKARIIKVSSTICTSRKHSHVNPPTKETPNLSNGVGKPLQGSDSKHEKDKNLEAGIEEALLAAEDGDEETLPKSDVYAALWAMLEAESENEAEEIPGRWDLDGILNNWGKIEPDMSPAGNDQGPLPAAN
ncbi:hypothetical protein PIB30_090306 [Stylosanthes scabra]|uniref:Uncharacterized protein n=1 Tax=Stylosanthes scabra TaxID=79078 RepID=A0ABU6UT41_9FABA|nr:hypothetical protein [Stylosanthes scabra]